MLSQISEYRSKQSNIHLLSNVTSLAYQALVYTFIIFLLLPLAIIPLISIGQNRYAVHLPQEFTLRWYQQLPRVFANFSFWEAVTTSLTIAVLTATISTIIGGLAAFGIVRHEFKYSTTLQTILISPLVFPWLLIGLGILLLVSRIPFIETSFWVLLIGHITFSIPYGIRTIGSSLENYDKSIDEAARDLGATKLETIRKVTLPLIKPGIVSSMVIIFILSFNMFIITLFLKGAGTKTVPILIFNLLRIVSPAVIAAIATVLMVGQLGLVLFTEVFVGISDYL
ncbi:ABC transporter permease [Halorussus salinisoli]|uniref:ABC transporter permease n=1 Tax=Halorussus salinisoli TaxID=2558242 RepID=UPI0010C187A0|nr:ABC transporter permease [Halorussus salinisoli]